MLDEETWTLWSSQHGSWITPWIYVSQRGRNDSCDQCDCSVHLGFPHMPYNSEAPLLWTPLLFGSNSTKLNTGIKFLSKYYHVTCAMRCKLEQSCKLEFKISFLCRFWPWDAQNIWSNIIGMYIYNKEQNWQVDVFQSVFFAPIICKFGVICAWYILMALSYYMGWRVH